MKMLTIAFCVLTTSLSMANNPNTPNFNELVPDYATTTIFAESISTDLMKMPYSKRYKVPMTLIAKRGDYSIYKCKSCMHNPVSGCELKGKNYHYFVFKNNRFHLSVNQCNENAVYKFFTENISE